MASIRGPAWALCTLGSALLILTGCDKFTQGGETVWARAALERNPDLTIVAADAEAQTFTVQVKGSNELHVVRVDEIIATVSSDQAAQKTSEPSETAQPSTVAQATADAEPAESSSAADIARPADEVNARNPSPPVNPGMASGTAIVRNAATGEVIASSDAATRAAAAAVSEATATTALGAQPAADGKKVLASGPGYSVTAGEPRANRPIRVAEATELKSPAKVAVERRYEPMICQGSRLLHIDGRNLEFEGDAVAAVDGCEIHITNSHIIAHGLGVSARAANVYIKNSIIEGDAGSVSASEGAKIYTQQSTFKGLSRRLDTATFTDLGGTNWN